MGLGLWRARVVSLLNAFSSAHGLDRDVLLRWEIRIVLTREAQARSVGQDCLSRFTGVGLAMSLVVTWGIVAGSCLACWSMMLLGCCLDRVVDG